MIHGLVERPLMLTMQDIERFPSVSRIHFIECPANGGMEWRAAQLNSLQFTHGMIELRRMDRRQAVDAAG